MGLATAAHARTSAAERKAAMPASAIRRLAAVLALGSIAAAAAPGCGSRGPLDTGPYGEDAGGAGNGAADAAPEAEAAPTADAAPDAPKDAGHDATIVDCANCLFTDCSMPILACIQSPPCQQAFQCVLGTCFGSGGGGGLDPACLLKCASSSPTGALQVLQVFMCVTGTCGPDCASLLSGLGGLGGGGGGGRRDAGMMIRPPIARAFSRWPELCGPEDFE
jgi:hypothetical protein